MKVETGISSETGKPFTLVLDNSYQPVKPIMAYVQKRLGHADIQTTMNTYVHLTQSDMKKAYKKFIQSNTNLCVYSRSNS